VRIVVGISGASGVGCGIRLLEKLQEKKVETHLIISDWAKRNIEMETDYRVADVEALAGYCHNNRDLSASIASGSFLTSGMVVIPCSMKSLSAIANGYADSLIARAADVNIKEQRKLILVPRETPLNALHLENMLKLARLGVVVMPPMLTFYHKPAALIEVVDHLTNRILDQLGIANESAVRWKGCVSRETNEIEFPGP